ncbi:hypothetical protein TNCV_1589021 [Trichonephila clavipes]|uniref:Uncharacterized protein n=1 Tax=Trichonephila clavipes TaxID=2585209 RepID=A0A8X6RFJ9_TRICX|nr:hypothetical protein TNCV_1589021 [Trichonephila clavipes]
MSVVTEIIYVTVPRKLYGESIDLPVTLTIGIHSLVVPSHKRPTFSFKCVPVNLFSKPGPPDGGSRSGRGSVLQSLREFSHEKKRVRPVEWHILQKTGNLTNKSEKTALYPSSVPKPGPTTVRH